MKYLPKTSGVYLIKFDRPIGNENKSVQYYLGWSTNISGRFYYHQKGQGAKLTRWAVLNGIGFQVIKVWKGEDRSFERKLKAQKKSFSRFDPHPAR